MLAIRLDTFAVPEILQLIGDRDGTIDIMESPEAPHIQLEVSRGIAHRYTRNGEEVIDLGEVISSLGRVAAHAHGMLSFRPTSDHAHALGIPISTLALKIAFQMDNIRASKSLPKLRDTFTLPHYPTSRLPSRKTQRLASVAN